MPAARIKHVAFQSKDRPILKQFYQQLFGLKAFAGAGEEAGAMSDGYVGLNINPRSAGRHGGFDHFGVEVDDVERTYGLANERYPKIQLLKRPSGRPFASFGMHDPFGNVFDVTQRGLANRRDIYADDVQLERTPRHITHFQLRTVDPELLVQFYQDVLELEGEGYHLTDGVVTMVIAPWKITDYEGMGIELPALEHLGFQVESLEQFDADLEKLVQDHPELAPRALKENDEGKARLKLFQTCSYGQRHLADPDGVLIDISEG